MGVLFASSMNDIKENTTFVATSSLAEKSTNVTKAIAATAVPFNKALQVLTQNKINNTDDQKALLVDNSAVISEQLVLLAQSSMPLIFSTGEKKPLSSEQATQSLECTVNQMILDKVQALFDKANQMQQELAIPKQLNIEQRQMPVEAKPLFTLETYDESVDSKTPSSRCIDAKELFGDKLTQPKVLELIVNNDLQQKVFVEVAKQGNETQKEKPVDFSVKIKPLQITEEKAQTLSNNQVVANTEQKNLVTFVGATSKFSEDKGMFSQEQSGFATTELFADNKKIKSDVGKETSESTVFALPAQTKDMALKKISFSEQIVKIEDTKELVDKMVEQARLTQKPGMSEMVIRLRPQNLGEMTIRIIAESGGAITASFHSNNAEVRGILQESLPNIKQELSNSGLKVNDVGVYAGLGDFSSFAGHEQRSAQENIVSRMGAVNGRSREEQELLDEFQQARNGENQNNDGGVDYRV